MKKGQLRYWLWWILRWPFGWLGWMCDEVYYWIEERMFRIEREWDW